MSLVRIVFGDRSGNGNADDCKTEAPVKSQSDTILFKRTYSQDITHTAIKKASVDPNSPGEKLKTSPRTWFEYKCFICFGVVLAMVAGYMNAVSIVLTAMPTAHVTGTSTSSGIQLGTGKLLKFVDVFCIIPSFILGSVLTPIIVRSPAYHMSRAYGFIFLLGTALLFVGFLLELQVDLTASRFGGAYITAFVCGMQNAASSMYSNNLMRSTHVTGTATDIGVITGKYLRGDDSEVYKLYLFVPMMTGFIVGGVVGGVAAEEYGAYAMIGNVIAFGGTGLLYYFYISTLRVFVRERRKRRRKDKGAQRDSGSAADSAEPSDLPTLSAIEADNPPRAFGEVTMNPSEGDCGGEDSQDQRGTVEMSVLEGRGEESL